MRDLLLLQNIPAKYLKCIFYQFTQLNIELNWGYLTGFITETSWCLMPRQILVQIVTTNCFMKVIFLITSYLCRVKCSLSLGSDCTHSAPHVDIKYLKLEFVWQSLVSAIQEFLLLWSVLMLPIKLFWLVNVNSEWHLQLVQGFLFPFPFLRSNSQSVIFL